MSPAVRNLLRAERAFWIVFPPAAMACWLAAEFLIDVQRKEA